LITIMLIVSISNSCFAFDDGDFQYWNTEGMSWKFEKNWKVNAEEEFRFGDDMQNFYYQHSDFGFSHSELAEWLELGAHYRQIFEEKSGVWKQENRPYINAAIKIKIEDIDFRNRSKFEYRHREDSDDLWRYRNKTSIKLPLKVTKFEIQPYIADEIFVDFEEEGLNRNRLYGGIELKVFDRLKGDIFYLWQSSEADDEWTDYHILGTKLKLSF